MSMLAEPRKRQRWSMNPNGMNWSCDDSKIGQKMLEKMGWAKGKGLGKTGSGMLDPLKVNVNSNQIGLGFTGVPDTAWVQHQDDFNSLLSSLNKSTEPTSDSPKEFKSLEEMSKKSLKRIHYHKFARGKDLKNATEKDLASIFGIISKKKTEPKEEEKVPTKSGETSESSSFGVPTVHGGCLTAYFSRKLAAKQNKSSVIENTEADFHDSTKKKPQRNEFEEEGSPNAHTISEERVNLEVTLVKTKKKAVVSVENSPEPVKDRDETWEDGGDEKIRKKSKRKRRDCNDVDLSIDIELPEQNDNLENNAVKVSENRKKSSDKQKLQGEDSSSIHKNDDEKNSGSWTEKTVTGKKRKKRPAIVSVTECSDEIVDQSQALGKKKSRSDQIETAPESIKKMKKKKRNADDRCEELETIPMNNIESVLGQIEGKIASKSTGKKKKRKLTTETCSEEQETIPVNSSESSSGQIESETASESTQKKKKRKRSTDCSEEQETVPVKNSRSCYDQVESEVASESTKKKKKTKEIIAEDCSEDLEIETEDFCKSAVDRSHIEASSVLPKKKKKKVITEDISEELEATATDDAEPEKKASDQKQNGFSRLNYTCGDKWSHVPDSIMDSLKTAFKGSNICDIAGYGNQHLKS
ncbi:unnamed protein product [Notodromas monacha]|uniref:G-patch domain-containing protein n=1 Tax=Notodromas monacha TaxID=399045 RepID=A0A7R9GGP7_9CRUS|nr:unnamed protein product [Notodromas monacha]CAG0920112.1 unnamed protein product [Notodromas monacha]